MKNKYSKVYILCPAYVKTGGTELLHQLAYKLKKIQENVYVVFYNKKNKKSYYQDDFAKYNIKVCNIEEIEDSQENTIIFPEVYTYKLNKFKKITKMIWWLSVDNYSLYLGIDGIKFVYKKRKLLKTIKAILDGKIVFRKNNIKKADYHLCQSYYAIDYLKQQGITEGVMYLSDYINSTYLELNNNQLEKEDIILYNPKKGIEFTNKLKEKAPKLKWIAIENLTTEQVKELLLKSKVYIDFGNHPGKDRFPREAAMCGCCVITGKRGSAKFYEDVPISDEFKFEDKDENLEDIIKKINQCLNEYEKEKQKFEDYKKFIMSEEKKFEQDIEKIFMGSDVENV